MSETAHQDHTEKKAFLVNSSSLKEVRTFCREVFEKLHIQQDLKDELVLAIAEAAQNIVKHAFKNSADTDAKQYFNGSNGLFCKIELHLSACNSRR